jgi:hypothetical protein
MGASLARDLRPRHRHTFEDVPLVMAKVDLTKGDQDAGRRFFGEVLRRAVELAGLLEKEAAEQMGVERSQFSRWLNGKENAQVWRFHAHDLLGPALLAAQAEVTPGATIRTVIELQRKVTG